MAAAVANVEAARTTLKQAELALQDTYLRAPITGWVLGRTLEVGGLAGNTGPGISLIDTSEVKAVFGMPDTALKLVRKAGQAQQIAIDALSHPVKGVVTAISPQADPKSRVFSVEVTIANPSNEMKPGMIGNLTLAQEEVAFLPQERPSAQSSVLQKNPEDTQFSASKKEGEKFMQRAKDVKIGAMHGNSLEIVEGVAAGDPIVVMGASTVRNGEEVRVIGAEQETSNGAQK